MKRFFLSAIAFAALTASARNVELNSSLTSSRAFDERLDAVKKIQDDRASVRFTLKNNTAKSIPLIIPNVMNPNLSPFSSSGVDLAIGQEIYFKEKGKKYLLLVVDSKIATDAQIDVGELLKERKKELGL
jgi:hypothetical protein